MSMRELMPWNWGKNRTPARRPEPDDPFAALHREMNRVFEDFGETFGLSPWRGETGLGRLGTFSPKVSVEEREDDIRVTAELPGLTEEQVDLTLSDGALVLKGEKKEEAERDGGHYTERIYGSFLRRIPLPARVDEAKAGATVRDGVLEVILPKSAEARTDRKKIAVKTG